MVFHLIVENFGKVQFADIELSNMVVLVGNNNSGKTMLMQLIYGLQKKLVDLPISTEGSETSDLHGQWLVRCAQNWFDVIIYNVNEYLQSNKENIVREIFGTNIPIGSLQISLDDAENTYYVGSMPEFSDESQSDQGISVDIREYENGINKRFFEVNTCGKNTLEDAIQQILTLIWRIILTDDVGIEKNQLFLPASRSGLQLLYRYYFAEETKRDMVLPMKDFLRFLQLYAPDIQLDVSRSNLLEFGESHMLQGKVFQRENEMFYIENQNGKEISNYSDYKVESSDKTTLMLGSDTMQTNNKVKLIPAKEGTAYIFIKKDDKIVASVPVTVVAARKVVTMTADKTAVTVSKSANANQETITLATKDQYGNDFAFTANDGSIEVTCEGAPDGVDKANVTVPGYASKNGNKVKYTVTGSNYVKGTYTFKFTFKKDGKEVCAQVVTVNVQEAGVAGDSISYSLNILNSNNATQTEEDAVVNADNTSNRIFTVNVSELLKGVEAKKLAKNDSLDDTKDTETDKTAGKVRGIYYTVKNAKGDVVYNTIPGSVTTGAAFNDGSLSATDQLTINVVKADASNVYAKLAEGTYTITATIEVEPKHTTAGYTYDSTKNTKTTITKSFVVKDTSNDAITDMKLKDAKVTSGASIQASLASVIQYSYDGVKYGADGDQSATIIAIEGYSNVIGGNGKITADNMTTVLPSGKTADVTKVTVRVAFHDADGNTIGYVDKEVKVSLSITAK